MRFLVHGRPTLLTVMVAAVLAGQPGQDWDQADRQVRRLAPSAFPELPAEIRQELGRRGCTIPQVWVNKKPHNVIRGSFLQAGQTDWAVLCSVKRASSILVFPNGAVGGVMELQRELDRDKLQGVGLGQIGYSRAITPAGRAWILSHNRERSPGKIDHEGIDDAFVEKASVVLYYRRGKWITLGGAD